ncbi:hypothetical protein MKX01_001128 [Papaver californicum]|nr:hypothetical protein MKX01_001128 [Papaver californicum]
MRFLHLNFLYFLSLIVFTNSVQVTAQDWDSDNYYCLGGDYINNSPFEKNPNETLTRVYGMVLCIGGITFTDCKNCADDLTGNATQLCPNSKEYVAWHEGCMLRYSNRSIFSVIENDLKFWWETSSHHLLLMLLFPSIMNFATGDVTFTHRKTNYPTIYGLVQCTPDISRSDCNICLLSKADDGVIRIFYPPSEYQGVSMITAGPICYMRSFFTVVPVASLAAAVILIFAIIIYLCKLVWEQRRNFIVSRA